MSEPEHAAVPLEVDLTGWSAGAAANPLTERERQATEVFLAALGMTATCKDKIYLKGGILVGAVYASGRNTADMDFSTTIAPSKGFADLLGEELQAAFPRAAAALGIPTLRLRMQSVKFHPRKDTFVEADFPAISVKFAYAKAGSKLETALEAGTCGAVLYADISFNEPITCVQTVFMKGVDASILAYSLLDLVSEKFRALLQQVTRDRYRRQDVFDLHYLLTEAGADQLSKDSLLNCFLEKCLSRGIEPNLESLNDPEVRARAKSEWATLAQEVGYLPDFDYSFELINNFYRSMPWPN